VSNPRRDTRRATAAGTTIERNRVFIPATITGHAAGKTTGPGGPGPVELHREGLA